VWKSAKNHSKIVMVYEPANFAFFHFTKFKLIERFNLYIFSRECEKNLRAVVALA
jgi:hypothetical protein